MIPQPVADELVKKYFHLGKPYKVILHYLKFRHGIVASMSWLKRRLRYLQLHRKGSHVTWDNTTLLEECIELEVVAGHRLRGYRAIWKNLRRYYGLRVKRKPVMTILRRIDPEGAIIRRNRRLKRRVYCCKGPNQIWHVDRNDKIKKFGFALHGCIDGYSRKILWLRVTPSNNDPRVIVQYYLDTVGKYLGCPEVIRSDYGTENCFLAATHLAFRGGIDNTYRYGKSTTNTRIEGWWSTLKRFKLCWWIEHLERYIHEGLFNPSNPLHRSCLAYCYVALLERELEEFMTEWNEHRIRKNHLSRCPSGIPNDIFNLPEMTGTHNYLCCNIDGELWLQAQYEYGIATPKFFSQEFKQIIDDYLVNTFGVYQRDITLLNAESIFRHLINIISA